MTEDERRPVTLEDLADHWTPTGRLELMIAFQSFRAAQAEARVAELEAQIAEADTSS